MWSWNLPCRIATATVGLPAARTDRRECPTAPDRSPRGCGVAGCDPTGLTLADAPRGPTGSRPSAHRPARSAASWCRYGPSVARVVRRLPRRRCPQCPRPQCFCSRRSCRRDPRLGGACSLDAGFGLGSDPGQRCVTVAVDPVQPSAGSAVGQRHVGVFPPIVEHAGGGETPEAPCRACRGPSAVRRGPEGPWPERKPWIHPSSVIAVSAAANRMSTSRGSRVPFLRLMIPIYRKISFYCQWPHPPGHPAATRSALARVQLTKQIALAYVGAGERRGCSAAGSDHRGWHGRARRPAGQKGRQRPYIEAGVAGSGGRPAELRVASTHVGRLPEENTTPGRRTTTSGRRWVVSAGSPPHGSPSIRCRKRSSRMLRY